jgi:hypothetical protein
MQGSNNPSGFSSDSWSFLDWYVLWMSSCPGQGRQAFTYSIATAMAPSMTIMRGDFANLTLYQ